MSSDTEEAPRKLSPALVETLQQVAAVHDGAVLLHSRLFAQWLHYAFPHECPYPHIAGTFSPLTPSEWFETHGKSTDASEDEMAKHMEVELASGEAEADDHMSQWTLEDEMRT